MALNLPKRRLTPQELKELAAFVVDQEDLNLVNQAVLQETTERKLAKERKKKVKINVPNGTWNSVKGYLSEDSQLDDHNIPLGDADAALAADDAEAFLFALCMLYKALKVRRWRAGV